MAKKQEEEVKQGLPAWMGTYGDMVTLLLCFFVLLFSMSSVDVRKFKEAIASFNDQIDIMPGGVALTDGERINNGVSQLNDIEIIIQNSLPTSADGNNLDGKTDEDVIEDKAELTEEELLEAALEKAEEVYDQVDQYLVDQGVREEVEMKYSLNYVKITLPGETLFDSGEAVIKPEGFVIIDVLGQMITEQAFSDYTIQIEGHTDNVPINTFLYKNNWYLSAARAIAVGDYLINDKGFDPTKISSTGYGEYDPIAPNDTAENKAKNRRVEMKIVLQSVEVDVEEFSRNAEAEVDVDVETGTEEETTTE